MQLATIVLYKFFVTTLSVFSTDPFLNVCSILYTKMVRNGRDNRYVNNFETLTKVQGRLENNTKNNQKFVDSTRLFYYFLTVWLNCLRFWFYRQFWTGFVNKKETIIALNHKSSLSCFKLYTKYKRVFKLDWNVLFHTK